MEIKTAEVKLKLKKPNINSENLNSEIKNYLGKREVFTLPPLFWVDSTRTPMDSTYPECQFFGSGAAGIFWWLSGDFPVQVCQTGESDGLSNRLSIGLSPNQQTNSTRNDWTAMESPTEVRWTPTDTKQTAFLISIINKKYKLNK